MINDEEKVVGQSKWAVYMVLVAFGYDFMVTFLGVILYWLELGGEPQLSGLVLGLYGGVSALSSVLLGFVSDRYGEKIVFLGCLILNIGGNLMYFFASIGFHESDQSSGQALLIASRILCGFSAGCSVVVLRWLIRTTPEDRQVQAMNRYRMVSVVARIIAPTVASFLFMIDNKKVGDFAFTGLSVAPLTTIGIDCLVFVGVIVLYENLPKSEEHVTTKFWRDPEIQAMWKDLVMLIGGLLLWLSALWTLFAQLPIVASTVYEAVEDLDDLWKAYIPIMAGSIASFLVLGRLATRFEWTDVTITIIGSVGTCISTILLFGFEKHPSEWFFYIGASLWFLMNVTGQTALRAIYAVRVSSSKYLATLLSLLFLAGGVGQFVGSSIGTAIAHPKFDYHHHNCTITQGESTNEQLEIFENVDCWYLDGYNAMVGVSLGLLAVVAISQFFILPRFRRGGSKDEQISLMGHGGEIDEASINFD
mmetsp:Transcript_6034/g.9387  ORF Transcript_6034/g.9387 Transcript_6034/m.9387 type:complete len:477 (+) Transcript_6034:59-1489(+)